MRSLYAKVLILGYCFWFWACGSSQPVPADAPFLHGLEVARWAETASVIRERVQSVTRWQWVTVLRDQNGRETTIIVRHDDEEYHLELDLNGRMQSISRIYPIAQLDSAVSQLERMYREPDKVIQRPTYQMRRWEVYPEDYGVWIEMIITKEFFLIQAVYKNGSQKNG